MSGDGCANTLPSGVAPPPSGFANMGTLVEIAERKRYHTYLKVLRDNADNIKERIRATHLVLAKLTEEKKKRKRQSSSVTSKAFTRRSSAVQA